MADSGLCLFQLPSGLVVCTSCDRPPDGSTYKSAAPEGLSQGTYPADDPRLNEGGDVLPQGGGEV